MIDKELEAIKSKKAEKMFKIKSMPKTIINIISKQHFNEMIEDYPEKVIIMDFWASWCGPCLQFTPIFEKLHEEFSPHFIFAKVNVDANQDIANHYKISGIPTLLFVRNGGIINKIVGAVTYHNLKNFLIKIKSDNN